MIIIIMMKFIICNTYTIVFGDTKIVVVVINVIANDDNIRDDYCCCYCCCSHYYHHLYHPYADSYRSSSHSLSY